MDHGFEHLGRHHHRLAGVTTGPDDTLLKARHVFGRHLDAEIATCHHQRVRQLDNTVQVIDGRRLFQLDQDAGLATDNLARLGHVVGPLNEGERHPVDP